MRHPRIPNVPPFDWDRLGSPWSGGQGFNLGAMEEEIKSFVAAMMPGYPAAAPSPVRVSVFELQRSVVARFPVPEPHRPEQVRIRGDAYRLLVEIGDRPAQSVELPAPVKAHLAKAYLDGSVIEVRLPKERSPSYHDIAIDYRPPE